MKLYLVQHGECISDKVDPDKPLSDKGTSDIKNLGTFLKAGSIKVEKIFHSSKTRAIQSAKILAEHICTEKEVQVLNNINPNDPVDNLINELETWNQDTAIVGHLPYLSKLVSMLVTKNLEKTVVNYIQGSICCLEKNDSGEWSICWMIRPELL